MTNFLRKMPLTPVRVFFKICINSGMEGHLYLGGRSVSAGGSIYSVKAFIYALWVENLYSEFFDVVPAQSRRAKKLRI